MQEQLRLSNVDFRLQRFQQDGQTPDYDIVLKDVPAQHILSARQVIPNGHVIGRIFFELIACLKAQAVSTALPYPLGIFHRTTGLCANWEAQFTVRLDSGRELHSYELPGGEQNDFEAAFVVDQNTHFEERDLKGTPVCLREFPSQHVLATIHQGRLNQRYKAHLVLHQWLDRNGYQLCAPIREYYYRVDVDSDYDASVIEIQFPIQKSP